MTRAQQLAFIKAQPMRAAAALANVQYVLAEMAATEEGRVWEHMDPTDDEAEYDEREDYARCSD